MPLLSQTRSHCFTQSLQNLTHNLLGRCRVLGIEKNILKFEKKWGLAEIKVAQYSSTKHIFKSEWGFGVWWGLSPLIPTNTNTKQGLK
jgi:hypothetical protein